MGKTNIFCPHDDDLCFRQIITNLEFLLSLHSLHFHLKRLSLWFFFPPTWCVCVFFSFFFLCSGILFDLLPLPLAAYQSTGLTWLVLKKQLQCWGDTVLFQNYQLIRHTVSFEMWRLKQRCQIQKCKLAIYPYCSCEHHVPNMIQSRIRHHNSPCEHLQLFCENFSIGSPQPSQGFFFILI